MILLITTVPTQYRRDGHLSWTYLSRRHGVPTDFPVRLQSPFESYTQWVFSGLIYE